MAFYFRKRMRKKIQHQSWKVALSVCFYGVIVKSSKVQKVSIFQIVSHLIFQVMETVTHREIKKLSKWRQIQRDTITHFVLLQ